MRCSSSSVVMVSVLALLLFVLGHFSGAHGAIVTPTGPYPLQSDTGIHFNHNNPPPVDFTDVIFQQGSETKTVPKANCTEIDPATMICQVDGPFSGTGIITGAFDTDPQVPIGYANRVYDAIGADEIIIEGNFGPTETEVIFREPRGSDVATVACTLDDTHSILTCPPLGSLTYSGAYQIGVTSNPPVGIVPVFYDLWAIVKPHIIESRVSIDAAASPLVVSFEGYGFGDIASPYRDVQLSEGACESVEVINPRKVDSKGRGTGGAPIGIKCQVDKFTPLTLGTILSAKLSVLENEGSLAFNFTHPVVSSPMVNVAYVALLPNVSSTPVREGTRSSNISTVVVSGNNFYTADATVNTIVFIAFLAPPEPNGLVHCFGTSVNAEGTELTCELETTPLAEALWRVTQVVANGLAWTADGDGVAAFFAVNLLPTPKVRSNPVSISPSQNFVVIHAEEGYGFLDGAYTTVTLSVGNCSVIEPLTLKDIICHFGEDPYTTAGTPIVELSVTSIVSTLSGYSYNVPTVVAVIRAPPTISFALGNLYATTPDFRITVTGSHFSTIEYENNITVLPYDMDCPVTSVQGDDVLQCSMPRSLLDSFVAGPVFVTVTVQGGVQSDAYLLDTAVPVVSAEYIDNEFPATTLSYTIEGTYFSKNPNLAFVTFSPGNISCAVNYTTPTSLRCNVNESDLYRMPAGTLYATVTVQSDTTSDMYVGVEPQPFTKLRPAIIRNDLMATFALEGEVPDPATTAFIVTGAGFSSDPTHNQLVMRPRICTYDESAFDPTSCSPAFAFGEEMVLVSSSYDTNGILTIPLPPPSSMQLAGQFLSFINTTGDDSIERSTIQFYSFMTPRVRGGTNGDFRNLSSVNIFTIRAEPIIQISGAGFSSVKSENVVTYGRGRVCNILSVNFTNIVCRASVPEEIGLGIFQVTVYVRGAPSDITGIFDVIYVEPPRNTPPQYVPIDDGVVSSRNIAIGVFFGGLAAALLVLLAIVLYGKFKNRPPPPADPKAYQPHEDRIPVGEVLAALATPEDNEVEMSIANTGHDAAGNEESRSGEEEDDGSDNDDNGGSDDDEFDVQELDDSLGRR